MKDGKHITLGIETSCDESAVGIVADGREELANIVFSQIEDHTKFGGVVPELASRKHLENINDVVYEALNKAEVTLDEIDLIGVANGPGLVGALLVGVATAKAISFAKQIPIVGVNHMHGHIAANYLCYKKLQPPFMALVVSGGHTNIVFVDEYNKAKTIGETRDDAIGEAFDKVARVMGLGYPGGPKMDKEAKRGNKDAIHFKRVYLENDTYDFSFSGIKTQVINYINNEKQKGHKINVPDVAASFTEATIEVIINKTIKAAKEYNQKKIVLAGGVAQNSRLREWILEEGKKNNLDIYIPKGELCGDNGLMIACSAYYSKSSAGKNYDLDAIPGLLF